MSVFSTGGVGHWVLAKINEGPISRQELLIAADEAQTAHRARKVRYIVGPLQNCGLVVHDREFYRLTDAGAVGLAALNEGRDVIGVDRRELPTPSVRIFRQAERVSA